jgi:hypothetical protein
MALSLETFKALSDKLGKSVAEELNKMHHELFPHDNPELANKEPEEPSKDGIA